MILFTYLCNKICLLLNTPEAVGTTLRFTAGVIHASSRRGFLKKNSQIELCMVDKGFRGRQYQKATLASNPKRDYHNTSSVTEMMDELSWTTLKERRSKTRLINFYKISNNKMEMPYRHAYTKSIENI